MAVHNRNQFQDFFFETMLPAIHHEVNTNFVMKADKIPFMFNVAGSDRSIEQTSGSGHLPAAPEKAEGSSVDYFNTPQGFDKTYTHLTYALGFQSTEEMVEDAKFQTIKKLSAGLGRSIFETEQIVAANHFNNGFAAGATAGPDGVALFSTAHPMLGGGTLSNTPAVGVDLLISSLEDAITNLANTRDNENKHVTYTGKVLLIHPTNKFNAREILKSTLQANTAQNNINSLMEDGLTIVEWDYLTDTGAWYLGPVPSDSEFWYWKRRAKRVQSDVDFDSGNGKTKADTRFSSGFSDWRGWYAST